MDIWVFYIFDQKFTELDEKNIPKMKKDLCEF